MAMQGKNVKFKPTKKTIFLIYKKEDFLFKFLFTIQYIFLTEFSA